jgi:DNA-binding beta-propeller fold protein YncE
LLFNDTLGDAPTIIKEADQGGDVITLGLAFETAKGGVFLLREDGSFSYAPPEFGVPAEGLTERFNYTIKDDDGDTSSATFTVTLRDNGLPLPSSLDFSSPARMSAAVIDNDPTILISSYDESFVGVLNLDTMRIDKKIRVAGKPTGVFFAFDRFYVGSRNGSVEVLDYNANRLYFLGGGQNAFGQVSDLAVDEAAGLIYILDSKNGKISVYRHDGSYAGYDIGAGILRQATSLAVEPTTGNIIVGEYGRPGDSARLRVFNSVGSELLSIAGATSGGMMGFGSTLFSTPQGLYADGMGNVYVVDARSGEVQVFESATGAQLYTIGSLGSGFEELFYPLGVYVDQATRDVYVADHGNNRIMVFREGGAVQ